jgi:post-segregation antitoxin (ccd killing protein)
VIAVKSRLTITIDEELIPRAKQYARRNGVSLSRLVEAAIRDLTPPASQSFSAKWRGRFRPADEDSARYRALAERYL